ncbi:hypothetical protein [Phycicoccus avicenniae]|uniref:hypothetical protein n=1 Tax=Phycicoccus avicenniae TaxID=2828860 RepID=UPI003D2A3A10
MPGYAARALPWSRLALAVVLVAVLMELVRWDPWVLWPLEGAAVGLLAGASAWCFDEPAAAVVDASPRGLGWRTLARSPGPLLLLGVWSAVVLHAGDEALFGHRDAVWLQGVAAVLAGAALAGWRRSRGEAMPGLVAAGVLVPVTTAWAVLRPAKDLLVVFPYGTTSLRGWEVSVVGWSVLAAGAVGVLALALSGLRVSRPRVVGGG